MRGLFLFLRRQATSVPSEEVADVSSEVFGDGFLDDVADVFADAAVRDGDFGVIGGAGDADGDGDIDGGDGEVHVHGDGGVQADGAGEVHVEVGGAEGEVFVGDFAVFEGENAVGDAGAVDGGVGVCELEDGAESTGDLGEEGGVSGEVGDSDFAGGGAFGFEGGGVEGDKGAWSRLTLSFPVTVPRVGLFLSPPQEMGRKARGPAAICWLSETLSTSWVPWGDLSSMKAAGV